MSIPEDLRYTPHLGLALGGGGALGAAHVGVIQVLHERGLMPSIITGTSAGAIAGGATAIGIDPYDLEQRVLRWGWTTFGRWTPRPGLGILTADNLHARVRRITGGDPLIEDLPVRFGAVATDVTTRAAVVLDHGSLSTAVSASIAVPGVFRPVEIEGRHLVDGGLVQNLPIEAAIGLGADHVIAVRVSPEWELPGFETTFSVHEFEIRNDVTVIEPHLEHRSQWQVRDLASTVQLGREAAEREFGEYPILNPRPEPAPRDSGPLPGDPDAPTASDAPQPEGEETRHGPWGLGPFLHRR
ncbi:patatin-like phospholipase family protein [Demequina globuliformis]|uniref:patatin-like phospholipase family protein n=1 Tax=Demequina globuliformis TaxID=676202 RepID=UPI0007842EAF|nr:patatin-like phospholipase family protein [Demequina globuliformis]